MNLNDYVRVLRRRWRLLGLVVLAAVAGAAGAAALQTPEYQATTVLVMTTTTGSVEPGMQATTAAQAATIAQFMGTEPVTEAAVAAAASSDLPARFPAGISATADGATPFITLTVTDSDPRWAQAVANAYAEATPAALEPIDPAVAATAEQVTPLSPAALPGAPSNPDWIRYLSLGLLLGLAFGVGIVALRESLDLQVRDPDDVSRTVDLPLLGAIPLLHAKETLPIRSSPRSPRAEAYRAVLAGLLNARKDGLPRALVVTSASSGEGVTTLTTNLALSIAGSGLRVTLVDGNLRAPRVAEVFGLENTAGLTDVISGRLDPAEALHTVPGTSLRILPAGSTIGGPVDQLTSPRTAEVLHMLEQDCDVLIIDTPPVLPVADALFLAPHATAVLLVARLGTTTRDRLRRARDAVRKVDVPILGVVVNGSGDQMEQLPPRRRRAAKVTSTADVAPQPDAKEQTSSHDPSEAQERVHGAS
jgi:capsular exopolysaccharide synthesis family protein